MPFTFEKTNIPDVIIINPKIFDDPRGYFFESYKKTEFEKNGIPDDFIQDNVSKSQKGVLRGLHYQIAPAAQAKLVRCTQGSIIDIAVDIRRSSKTFKQSVVVEINASKKNMLYIPAGFAHGFYTLENDTEVHYKTSTEYNAEMERGIIWNDSDLNVDWPIAGNDPLLSEKDLKLPHLTDADIFD